MSDLRDKLSELAAYPPDELDDPVSLIEPLSSNSLAALSRLSRYKPPPDPYSFPAGRSAVLVVLFGSRSGNNLNVLLTTRSETLRTYPGQVALPGGKMDDTDMNLEATARREAFEEVGIPIDVERIRYLTTLPPFLARSMMLVTPVVAFMLDYSLRPLLNVDEVSSLFSFPLEAFLTASASPRIFTNTSRLPPAVLSGEAPYHTTEDYGWYDRRPHRFHSFAANPQAITGLTAEILIHVASIAYARPPDFPLLAPTQRSEEELIARSMQDPKWDEYRRRWEEKRAAELMEEKREARKKGKL